MTALASGLNLRAALRRTARDGFTYVPRALDGRFRKRLWDEVARGPFGGFEESFGAVRQQIDGYDVRDPMDAFPLIAVLRDELADLVRGHGRGVRGLATWRPNEIGVARYRSGSIGITPHLDGKWYRRLVAVVTVQGTAAFEMCRDRAGDVVAAWDAGPGDLVLMRAPGLAGHRDGRPLHRVHGPTRGERCSLGFRMAVGGPSTA